MAYTPHYTNLLSLEMYVSFLSNYKPISLMCCISKVLQNYWIFHWLYLFSSVLQKHSTLYKILLAVPGQHFDVLQRQWSNWSQCVHLSNILSAWFIAWCSSGEHSWTNALPLFCQRSTWNSWRSTWNTRARKHKGLVASLCRVCSAGM